MIKRHFNELEEIQFPSLGQHGATTLRVASSRLETGMYVVELDGAWNGSPFPKSGMLLSDPHQVAAMRARSESALIDIERSDHGRHTAIRIAAQLFGSEQEAAARGPGLATAAFRNAPARLGPARIPTSTSSAPPPTQYQRLNAATRIDRSAAEHSAQRAPGTTMAADRPAWGEESEARDEDPSAQPLPVIPDYAPIDSGGRSAPRRDIRIASAWRHHLHELMTENGRVLLPVGEERGLLARARAWFSTPRLPKAEPGQAIATLSARFGEPLGQHRHTADCAIDETLGRARTIYARLLAAHAQALQAARQDQPLPWPLMQDALYALADSVIEHPDSVMWCDRMHEQRSLGNRPPATPTVLMAGFARHLGLSRDAVMAFAAIGMCIDLGKAKLPREIVNLSGQLDKAQFEQMKSHVAASVSLLHKTPGVAPEIIRGVAEHHERIDGSGYPRGLEGKSIGLHGASAAIVDAYTALISARSYANPLSPEDALAALIGWSDKQLDPGLVEQFALAIGLFPIGSAVELADGGLGMVIEVEQDRGFGARVLVLTGPDGKPIAPRSPSIDIRGRRSMRAEPRVEIRRGPALKIARGLPVGAFGVRLPDYHARPGT